MREPRLRSSPSIFHPSTNRRMYRFASNGEMGEPCGIPRRLSWASVVRVFLPRSSVSSTGQSSHVDDAGLVAARGQGVQILDGAALLDSRFVGGARGALLDVTVHDVEPVARLLPRC